MPTTVQQCFVKCATALGAYYTSPMSKTALKHYLRGCATTSFKSASDRKMWWERDGEVRKFMASHDVGAFKRASIGGDQEQGFEQAFASLAYTYIKDKSPRLLDFIVGFQLVDRNEDSTKAIGIFGFKVGDQWLYAPVFFLNGDMKGHELLYIKKQDTFVPMKENWVNSLISRKPHVLGEGSKKNTHQLGGLMPNLSKFRHMPSGTKYGNDGGELMRPQLAEWTHGFMPIMGAIGSKSDAVFAKHAGLAEALDLRKFLNDFPLLKMAFEKAYMKYPGVKQGFDKFYGKNFFYEMGVQIKQSQDSLVKRARSYILPPAEAMKKLKEKGNGSLIPEPEKRAHPVRAGKLRVHYLADYMKAAAAKEKGVKEDAPSGFNETKPALTEEQRKKLLNDTVLIEDERDSADVSTAYNTQVRVELGNPTETGLYEVLEKPGSFDQMLVIHQPHTGRGREAFDLVVRKASPRNWLNIHPTNVWVKQCDCPEKAEFTKYVEGLDGSDSLEKGGTYIALHSNGSGTCPFIVREDYGDGCYRVEWKDYCRYNQQRPAGLPPLSHPGQVMDVDDGYSSWDAKIWINKRHGTKLRSVRGELMIPEEFKILKVQAPLKPKKEEDGLSIMPCCSPDPLPEAGSDDQPIMPGNLVDIQTMLHEKEASLQIHDLGANEVLLKSRNGSERMNKLAALVNLVTHHGLGEQQARQMLKEAAKLHCHNRVAKYYVKYASPFLGPGPTAPQIPEPWTGVEMNGPNAVNSIYPQEEFLPVDELSSQLSDTSVYDPFFEPDQNAMQVAQQASNSGQKEVFDASMISGMLKSVSQDNLVNKHLGDLMKALDKLGRILFMFYWHQEEFEDRYGKQDLPELEDSLRNAFEVLGDVVLWLKEKTVGGGMGLDMASVGRQNSEPSIEEAARN